ncbi:MAG: hypothetical protein Tsb0017_27290 [Geothermobacteraceae bacterium]
MAEDALFVVTVASEKGGVGKTTIATNLAVYLKALCEDLPVTIASFDNHFSVDNMFAIGGRSGRTVAALFDEAPLEQAVSLGEYGVGFLRSERRLELDQPDDHARLRRKLAASGLQGILVLDTRPLLDGLTRQALEAADLVLVPVKDRPSLVNAASVVAAAGDNGSGGRVWLVPSLIDGRLRLANGAGMRDYLTVMAGERDLQVAPVAISKSPKVEGLAAGFGSRIHPVLTRARGTAVHRQLRDLAAFVLDQRKAALERAELRCALVNDNSLPARLRQRLQPACPLCGRPASGASGVLLLARSGRLLAAIHDGCFDRLLESTETGSMVARDSGFLAFQLTGPGLSGTAAECRLALFDRLGGLQLEEQLAASAADLVAGLFAALTGQDGALLTRETAIVPLNGQAPAQLLKTGADTDWRRRARAVWRSLNDQF